MAILTIDGAEMPSPSGLDITYKVNGKAEMSASGDTIMDRLSVKRTIKATFSHLTAEAAKTLLVTAVQNVNFFDLTYYDPLTGGEVTGVFRVSGCNLSPWCYKDNAPVGYRNGSVTMEEK